MYTKNNSKKQKKKKGHQNIPELETTLKKKYNKLCYRYGPFQNEILEPRHQ